VRTEIGSASAQRQTKVIAEVLSGVTSGKFPNCKVQVISDGAVLAVAPLPIKAVEFDAIGARNSA
jgi:hypothetical protein